MLSKEQLDNFRNRLMNEKNEILERFDQNDHFGLERGHFHEAMGELSSIDNHPADEGESIFMNEKKI